MRPASPPVSSTGSPPSGRVPAPAGTAAPLCLVHWLLRPQGVLRLLLGPASGVDCCPRLAAYSTSALGPWFSARGSRSSVSARGLLHPCSWLLGSRLTALGSPSVPGVPGVLSQLSPLATGGRSKLYVTASSPHPPHPVRGATARRSRSERRLSSISYTAREAVYRHLVYCHLVGCHSQL